MLSFFCFCFLVFVRIKALRFVGIFVGNPFCLIELQVTGSGVTVRERGEGATHVCGTLSRAHDGHSGPLGMEVAATGWHWHDPQAG